MLVEVDLSSIVADMEDGGGEAGEDGDMVASFVNENPFGPVRYLFGGERQNRSALLCFLFRCF